MTRRILGHCILVGEIASYYGDKEGSKSLTVQLMKMNKIENTKYNQCLPYIFTQLLLSTKSPKNATKV